MSTRYEILPFGSVESEAEAAPDHLVITVTCSPRHGLDHTVDVATRVAMLGHDAVVHVAARMVRDESHLDAVLERLAAAGVDDLFLIGGDGAGSLGPYASAVELLPAILAHRHRPRRIGVGAYPEGHPMIDPPTLARALRRKAESADYMTTQLCFDPVALTRWIEHTRAEGVDLPVYVGIPGAVDRRRLLEVSMRVGVGASIGFLRKQHGLRQFLGRPEHAAHRLHDTFAPLVGDPALGIAGLHFFTFNRLSATLAWEARRDVDRREANNA
jgi:methylenetetrahydrofolate reductase (NADPH)